MALERLDGARFGFEGTCFVCNSDNPRGLQIPFFLDTDRQRIVAYFTLDEHFAGAPELVHGGATLAIIDDGMAWAAIAIGGRLALTKETTANFEWPIRVGKPYRLEVRITEQDARRYVTDAEVVDSKERACVRATALMTIVDLGGAAGAGGG